MKRRSSTLSGALLVAAFMVSCDGTTSSTQLQKIDCTSAVRADDASFVGKRDQGACAWLGIRFAEPLVPENRFLPAEGRPPSGEIQATTYGNDCIQGSGPMSENPRDEDCLFLNIWAPEKSPDGALNTGLPVMVWFHGGGFTSGSGGWSLYNGSTLARENVVIVTVNYRLGALGFAAPVGVTHESGYELNGNLGVLDARTSLEWVQENIARFGGNPDNVTIFGESAGSWMVCTLLGTGVADAGLTHRAVMQSGGCYAARLQEAHQIGAEWIAETGCPRFGPIAYRCLQDIDADRFDSPYGMGMRSGAWPVVDGKVLPDHPIDVLRGGGAAGIPLIAGYNRDEFAVLALGDLELTGLRFSEWYEFEDMLEDALGVTDTVKVMSLYAPTEFASPFDAGQTMIVDQVFGCSSHDAAAVQDQDAGGYLYRFALDQETFLLEPYTGAFHGLEIPFVFGNLDLLQIGVSGDDGLSRARAFSDLTRRYWTRFATTGDPNGGDDPVWPRYGESQAAFELQPEPVAQPGLLSDRCAFWNARLPDDFNQRIDYITEHLPFETDVF